MDENDTRNDTTVVYKLSNTKRRDNFKTSKHGSPRYLSPLHNLQHQFSLGSTTASDSVLRRLTSPCFLLPCFWPSCFAAVVAGVPVHIGPPSSRLRYGPGSEMNRIMGSFTTPSHFDVSSVQSSQNLVAISSINSTPLSPGHRNPSMCKNN